MWLAGCGQYHAVCRLWLTFFLGVGYNAAVRRLSATPCTPVSSSLSDLLSGPVATCACAVCCCTASAPAQLQNVLISLKEVTVNDKPSKAERLAALQEVVQV